MNMNILNLYLEKLAEEIILEKIAEEELIKEALVERPILGAIPRWFSRRLAPFVQRGLEASQVRALSTLGEIGELGRRAAGLAPEPTLRESLRAFIRRHPVLTTATGIPLAGLGIGMAGKGIGSLIESARGRQVEYPFDIYYGGY